MSTAIDVMHMDRDRVICAFEIDGLIVDPGPASCVDTLLDRLGPVEPRALLLTHIHLDHAGATGVLCRRFPELQVYVHERGAPHLIDPSKLLASASRLYGDEMDALWGEVAPVPAERIQSLAGGETVEGFRVAYTPGHASHHVCYLHEDTGDAYVGDMAGVRIPPYEHTLAPTPPPDIDVEQWLDSLHTVASWNPQIALPDPLRPGHRRGRPASPDPHGARSTRRTPPAPTARSVSSPGSRAEVGAAVDQEGVLAYEQAAPPDQLYKGLERYWRKRAEAA